ncbi:MAG: N-acetylmuramoyl-L-alanine amidase family protein [Peptostreptococcaceae bacterium]
MSNKNNKLKSKKPSNKNQKGRRRKKKRIRIVRLLIVIFLAALFVFGTYKSAVWVGQTLKNIEKKADKKNEEPVENIEQQKHFDLKEEVNKDLGKKYTVLIDPGHGGNDKGTQSKDGEILEKDVSLILSKRIANKLSQQEDVQVIMSRTDDKYMSLGDRAAFANSENVDILVSIHLNAESGGTSANGVETYYKRGVQDGSDKLAESIQKSINSYVDVRDRGTREDMFQVLRDSTMPSVLIECGFLTNQEESKKLLSQEYQESLTEGIAQGILSYLDSSKTK